MADQTAANRATILGIYEAFGRGDLDTILAAIADDVDFGLDPDHPAVALAPFLRNVRRKADVPGYFAGMMETFAMNEFRPIVVAAEGDDVVSIIHEDFTVHATGKRAVTNAVHHFTFGADGRVVRYRPIVDSLWEAAFRP